MNKKNLIEKIKPVLSKSPLLTIAVMFATLIILSICLSEIPLELKIFSVFSYIILLGFYFTGVFKHLIWYFVSLVTIVSVSSLISLQLEILSPGITGISLPASLFMFFFSGYLLENKKVLLKTEIKILISVMLTLLSILIVSSLFMYAPLINQYFALIIPFSISLLLGIFIYFFTNIIKK